jgi:hypothetical protein
MATLRELHLNFRREDVQGRQDRHAKMDQRMLGIPEAQRECKKAIRCDPRDTGKCRWCGERCAEPVAYPQAPYDENQGDVLKREAYNYFWRDDEADLPYWYHGAGRMVAA